jgi:hypothetical protein
MRGGRLKEVVGYERWSVMRGGRLKEAVGYERWSVKRGGRLREVVDYLDSCSTGEKVCFPSFHFSIVFLFLIRLIF